MARTHSLRTTQKRFWDEWWDADDRDYRDPPGALPENFTQRWRIGKVIPHKMYFAYDKSPHWFVNATVERPNRRQTQQLIRKIIKGYDVEETEFPKSRRPQNWYW